MQWLSALRKTSGREALTVEQESTLLQKTCNALTAEIVSCQRNSDQYFYRRWLAVHLRGAKDPFAEGLSDRITHASVGSLFDCDLADLAVFVYDCIDHNLSLCVLLQEVGGNLRPFTHHRRGRQDLLVV